MASDWQTGLYVCFPYVTQHRIGKMIQKAMILVENEVYVSKHYRTKLLNPLLKKLHKTNLTSGLFLLISLCLMVYF